MNIFRICCEYNDRRKNAHNGIEQIDLLMRSLENPSVSVNDSYESKISKLSSVIESNISKFDNYITYLFGLMLFLVPVKIISFYKFLNDDNALQLFILGTLFIILSILIFILPKNTNFYYAKTLALLLPLFYSILFFMRYTNISLWTIFILHMTLLLLFIHYSSKSKCLIWQLIKLIVSSIAAFILLAIFIFIFHTILVFVCNNHEMCFQSYYFESKISYFSFYTLALSMITFFMGFAIMLHNEYISYCNISKEDLRRANNIGYKTVYKDEEWEK